MTAIEEARAALAEPFDERYASRQALVFRDRLRALIAEYERLSVPPSDDERDLAQALFRTLYDAGVSFQSGDLIPRLTATVRAAGFRRQGPPSDDEGPARIVQMPPSPETSARYWESHCPVCTTHEGMYRYANDERLIALRDEHNARHRETPLPGPITDDDREALDQIMREADGYWPDAREAILAAGFRRQGPITDARPWRPEDGDTRCQVCGRRNPVWWANNDDWNALMPDDGILCPSCYHSRWLEAAERVRSAVPCVECSGTGWLATYQRDGSATADSCRDCGGSGLRAAGPWEPVPSTTEQESE